jgi:predicted PurR-regulated permease PerM
VTLLFAVLFMLLFGGRLVDALLAEAVPATRIRYERVLAKTYTSIGGYLGGLVFIALVNAVLNGVVLAALGLPFFVPLAILSGIGSFVPYVGAIAAGGLIALVGLASGGPWMGLAVIGWYLLYQQVLENHILIPLVYRRTIQLNPLVTLLAVVFLGDAAGIVGAILAVPLTAIAQIVVRELILLRRERLRVPATGEVTDAIEHGPVPPPRPPEELHPRH